MLSALPNSIHAELAAQLGCVLLNFNFVSGGCINSGGKLQTSKGDYFLKWNSAIQYPGMFVAESKGLDLLRKSSSLNIPDAILSGAVDEFQFLVLEFVSQGKASPEYWSRFGEQLSQLHRTSSLNFGLDFDNYIGSLPQKNKPTSSWITFFTEQRLRPQVEIAFRNDKIESKTVKKFDTLFDKLPNVLIVEKPSLMHGDLWSGNLIVDGHGNPCLIDPAVYFGHREAEIGFTYLFGGFHKAFYESYQANFPLENGFKSRIDLYNLYPLLVHLNLFGKGYLNQVVSILDHYV